MAFLEIRALTKDFGGLRVVDRLSFGVEEGEIVSLIGPNGAGKTTVLNLISGLERPGEGEIRLGGRSLVGMSPHAITACGVGRTFQTLRLFLNMTVLDNVMAAAFPHTRSGFVSIVLRTRAWREEEERIRRLAKEKLSFFGERLVGYRFHDPAYSLSYANRRRLEIARALAVRPRLLLLDEPAAGMNPRETEELTRQIGRLRDEEACTILFIEHDMGVVRGISDRVIALDHGQKIAEGSFQEVASDEQVVEAYLGRRHDGHGGRG